MALEAKASNVNESERAAAYSVRLQVGFAFGDERPDFGGIGGIGDGREIHRQLRARCRVVAPCMQRFAEDAVQRRVGTIGIGGQAEAHHTPREREKRLEGASS
jgi:hypothetical protein